MEQLVFILVCVCLLPQTQCQRTTDQIVRDALNSVLSGGAQATPQPPSLQLQAQQAFVAQAPIQGAGQATLQNRMSSIEPPIPAARAAGDFRRGAIGSSAVYSLARFNRMNAPRLNQRMDEKAKFIINVGKAVADSPEFGRGSQAALRRVVNSSEVQESFRNIFNANCFEKPTCDFRNPYRETDGSCNNAINPLLGKSFTPQRRVLPNAYDDFQNLPRTRSVRGGNLPSAREVSNEVLKQQQTEKLSNTFTPFLTHHGQLIDHDVIATPSATEPDGSAIVDCCLPSNRNKECFNINVRRDDPFFGPRTCMHFVRHLASPSLDCSTAVREQQNGRTAFVDGTMVYGFDRQRELELRSCENGRLAESDIRKGLLPRLPGCPIQTQFHCFDAGDHRPMETPTLTVMHTTWLRRHNLIADELRKATGIKDDEVLFQEAKRIVIAELQHLTYNEFLPAVLDETHMRRFGLRSRPRGHANTYNPYLDPRTINSFGVAAFRMGHTLVRNVVGQDDGKRTNTSSVHLHFEIPDLMFSPLKGYEFMARWMAKNAKSKSDAKLVEGIRDRLFEGEPSSNPIETASFDLGALNIQRGRDHGIPSYNEYRKWCGLRPAYHFSVYRGGLVDHSIENARRLSRVYRNTFDIDLFAGAISETPRRGSILGPTFQCIIANQFSRYKFGDRFFYEHLQQNLKIASFTERQLREIKQMTYSKVMCSVVKNDGGGKKFQPKLMEIPGVYNNRLTNCEAILGRRRRNRLGFDIRPFAQELRRLGGCRRCNPPVNQARCEKRTGSPVKI